MPRRVRVDASETGLAVRVAKKPWAKTVMLSALSVFMLIDLEAFDACFTAWASAQRLTPGRRCIEDKSNEITAIPALPDQLALQNGIVTVDAMGCQQAIAERILARGGDYLLTLKASHPLAHAAVAAHFEKHCFGSGASAPVACDAFEDGHGCLVRRRVLASTDAAPDVTFRGDESGVRDRIAARNLARCTRPCSPFLVATAPTRPMCAADASGPPGTTNICPGSRPAARNPSQSRGDFHASPSMLQLVSHLALRRAGAFAASTFFAARAGTPRSLPHSIEPAQPWFRWALTAGHPVQPAMHLAIDSTGLKLFGKASGTRRRTVGRSGPGASRISPSMPLLARSSPAH